MGTRRAEGRLGFGDFYDIEFQRVFRTAWALCRNLQIAQDATQEAFERAFARWHRLNDQPWAVGWVITTAMNIVKREQRRRDDRTSRSSATTRGPDPDRVDLAAALRRLPTRQRRAVVLHHIGDLSLEEVAAVMNISVGTVKTHLHRGRARLHQLLEERDE